MTENEKLDLLYQENAKVAAIFWEWRYKLMASFFAVSAALFALAGWFYQQSELRVLLFAPLALGAIFCLTLFVLDFRNAAILRECYRIGEELEIKLYGEGAIFKSIGAPHSVTYTVILRSVYAGVGLLLLVLSYRAYQLFR
ncbi:MAG TPA: hypothetical protein VF297_10590 [Pyrinomonadaceae bacterium]